MLLLYPSKVAKISPMSGSPDSPRPVSAGLALAPEEPARPLGATEALATPMPDVAVSPWPTNRLDRRDRLWLGAFCLLLFGYYMFCGRPLSLHEARLPELSREMLAHHNWLFPQSGGRPWLERPPLPMWIVIGTSLLLGQHCDREWVVRLPSVLMGMSVVLMTAWIAGAWFGRKIGLLSGFILATMYEFYTYSILAEEDIYLAALVTAAIALFVKLEFTGADRAGSGPAGADRAGSELAGADRAGSGPAGADRAGLDPAGALTPTGLDASRTSAWPSIWRTFFSNRPLAVWTFFLLLGVMNIVKSPLLGAIAVVGPVAAFVLLGRAWGPLRRYLWLWGLLLFALLLFCWTEAAAHVYPDVVRNWEYDYRNTKNFDEPFWYYPLVVLPGLCQPWILAAIPGFLVTRRAAWRRRGSAERFLWCWALMPVLILSIPHRKHHHYLVPSLAPWAILAAVGLSTMWRDWQARSRLLVSRRPSSRRPTSRRPISRLSISRPPISRRPITPLAPILIATTLSAIGIALLRARLPMPLAAVALLAAALIACLWIFLAALSRRQGSLAAGTCFVAIAIAYCWGQSYSPDLVARDTAFLRRVDQRVPAGALLCVNSDLAGEMDFFRNQFYVRPSAVLLHNLTFLRDRAIAAPDVWIVTRGADLPRLQTLGQVSVQDQSAYTRRERSAADRFTLFHLRYDAKLPRYPRPAYVNTLQAMDREPGPYCGPPF